MIPCPLRAAAGRAPDALAALDATGRHRFADLDRRAATYAAALGALGARPGEVVAIALPMSRDYPALLHGLWRIGAVAFPIDPRFPGEYAGDTLARVGCARLIAETAAAEGVVRTHHPDELVPPPGAPDAGADVDPAAPATLTLTSGSAGPPKAAAHSLAAHLANAARSNANIPLGPGDRWLWSLAPHHVAGLGVLFRCLVAGATVAVPTPGAPLAASVAALGATHLSLVATQLRRLLAAPADLAALRGVKAILLGGSGMPDALLRAALDAGLPIHTSYGMTEMATQVATTRPGDRLDRLRTAGPPLAAGTLRIAPDGEIQVRGETLFLGYWDRGGLRPPATLDGWFRTGDLGEVEAGGCLRVTGRIDNMFVAGGENIQPEEVEAAILALPGVARVVVVPAPDPEFGQVPVAYIAWDNAPMPAQDLRAALAARLPRFKIPKAFHPWPVDLCGPDEKPKRRKFAAWAARSPEHPPISPFEGVLL